MTQRDKWKNRDCVLKYYAFKDEVRSKNVQVPDSGACITFAITMPKSWSKKKRTTMEGQPHQQKPDIDNLLKALLDSCYEEDCTIHHLNQLRKIWATKGYIEIV